MAEPYYLSEIGSSEDCQRFEIVEELSGHKWTRVGYADTFEGAQQCIADQRLPRRRTFEILDRWRSYLERVRAYDRRQGQRVSPNTWMAFKMQQMKLVREQPVPNARLDLFYLALTEKGKELLREPKYPKR